jgi:hypothetical protein
MKNVKAVAHSVLGFFVNPPGQRTTNGGLIMLDDNGTTDGIRTRFFEVHDVGGRSGVEQDIKPGDIVAVAHGRWSRGFEVESDDGRKLYALDPKDILGIYDGPKENLVNT